MSHASRLLEVIGGSEMAGTFRSSTSATTSASCATSSTGHGDVRRQRRRARHGRIESSRDPRHPYTRRLFEAIPRVRARPARLPGSPALPSSRGTAARLRVRRPLRFPVHRCDELPALVPLRGNTGRLVRCWRASEQFGGPSTTAAKCPRARCLGARRSLEVLDPRCGLSGQANRSRAGDETRDRATRPVLLADARVVPGRRR